MGNIEPLDTVQVVVEHVHDEDGIYYVAACDDLMFTTEAETFESLLENIQECLVLNLKEGDPVREFNVFPQARIQLIMELQGDYA
jgi:predicted RNase H-like HicB family nuclease